MNIPADFWQSKELWAAVVQAAAGVLQGLATVGAVWLAYCFGLRQMRKQTQVQVRQDLRHRQADALQVAWGLLQCLTLSENGHNFLRYEQSKKSAQCPAERRYFVNIPNAQAFVFKRLPAAFYASGAGLHWRVDIKDKFFECRTLIYGLLLAEGQAHAPTAEPPEPASRLIQKLELAQRIETLYGELNDLLRKELQTVYAPNS
jgi:hypothetical protein